MIDDNVEPDTVDAEEESLPHRCTYTVRGKQCPRSFRTQQGLNRHVTEKHTPGKKRTKSYPVVRARHSKSKVADNVDSTPDRKVHETIGYLAASFERICFEEAQKLGVATATITARVARLLQRGIRAGIAQ